MEANEYFMAMALEQARIALSLNETPIGAVIARAGEVIGRGYNMRNTAKNPLAHAEIIAMHEAAGVVGDWRLEGCAIYVTVEPCPMCAGAIVQARMDAAVFGAKNPKAGCGGSILNILSEPRFNHQVNIISGVMEKECAELMTEFFRNLRACPTFGPSK